MSDIRGYFLTKFCLLEEEKNQFSLIIVYGDEVSVIHPLKQQQQKDISGFKPMTLFYSSPVK